MKKLTAGIFTVLMGLVSVNAADAAVASKAYVDAKAASEASAAQSAAEATAAGALSSAKTELEGKINAKVAQTAYDTKIAELATADATNLQAAKDYADGLDAAQKTAFETADSAINAKIGTVAEDKTVVQMIAEAQSAATYDDAELRGLIGDNADAISDMDAAYKAADQGLANDIAANTGAIAAINDVNNGILKQAQTYADQAEADAITAAGTAADTKIENALKDYTNTAGMNSAISTAKTEAIAAAKEAGDAAYDVKGAAADAQAAAEAKVTELANGAVKTNTEAIAALDGTYVSESEMSTFKTSNTEAIADAKQAGTDAAAALETYKTSNNTAVANAQSAADAAAAAAAAAQTAANNAQADATQALADAAAAQATANAAIPAPSAQCSDPANKCVLTYNNAEYAWEVIERSNGQ